MNMVLIDPDALDWPLRPGGNEMTRDPFWDDLKQIYKEKFDADRKRFLEQAHAENDGGWAIHTDYHWSRMLDGHRLDYWPSRKKYRYRGKTKRGDVQKLIDTMETKA